MSDYVPSRLVPLLEFAGTLDQAARESLKALRKAYREHSRAPRGGTLRPGPETPLWNELAALAAIQLSRYGDKANLARILGVPRQRVHEYLVAKTTCPDTERALMLLAWALDRQTRPAAQANPKVRHRPQK
ncbi:MAG: hypothetical protein ACHQ4G_08895 [Opitutales bacterium]